MQHSFMNKRQYALLALLFVSVLTNVACGFHLRGSGAQLTDTGRIFVDASRDITVTEQLRKVLSDRSFTVVDNRDQAEILLRVTGEQLEQRIVSIQSTGQVSEFELSHSLSIQVAQSLGDEAIVYDPDKPPNRVAVVREYTNDQSDVLGKEGEAEILRLEMREELVLQVVLRTIATLASSVASLPINEASGSSTLAQ